MADHRRAHFGYRPLLAESFPDPEAYAGNCYKASNWEPVGVSEGYSRHRADFYIANERPKKLWLRELCPQARAQLRIARMEQETAEESLRVSKNKYSVEAALLREVLEKQTALEQANRGYYQAILTFWGVKADWDRAIGEER